MSNSSSSSDVFLHSVQSFCANITLSHSIYCAFTATRLFLLLPSSFFILYLGYQQRSFKPASHSDILTYHLVVLELIWSLGSTLFFGGFSFVKKAGFFLMHIIFVGETLFHILTCVDRYLAVVHPVAYRRLQNGRGATIRDVCILCAWLLCFLWSYVSEMSYPALPIIPVLCLLVSSLVIVSFCSLFVLRALVRPGPGSRRHADQTKQRVFVTITAIMGVLCLWFVGFLIATSLKESYVLGARIGCVIHKSLIWLSLPSSLVLQLLYLHKKQKLSFVCLKSG